MTQKIYNVLFICTGNSARSIMAEAIMNHLGRHRFKAYSAGSHPRGAVHPMTLDVLYGQDYDVSGLYSKGWDEFARADAPKMDFIFTVCDRAAGENCPVWPGQPITAHWGFTDPAVATGSEEDRLKVFRTVENQIVNRIRLFLNLPIEKLDHISLQAQVRELGHLRDA